MMCAFASRMYLIRALCALLLFPVLLLPCSAQTTLGSIFGTITDSSGAVIPDATITVTSVERGTTRTTKTSSGGTYRVAELEPGTYRVSVERQGFAKTQSEPIPLAIEATVRADLTMRPGSTTTTVEVTAANPLLQTGSAEVSMQITEEELHDLPSLDRNIVGLMSLAPGVTGGNYDPSSPTSGGRVGQITGAEVVSMGTPPVGNNFLLDGVTTNMEFSGTIAARPPMDMAAGFQTQIAQFPADEGRASGAILNMSLKSGTNKFHGSTYGYVQNNYVNAQPKNYSTLPVQLPYHRYEYGANLGGPIVKNKLFFFVGYEGLKQLQASQSNYTVPAMGEKILYPDWSTYGITPTSPSVAAGCDGIYMGSSTDANGFKFGGAAVYDPTSIPWGSTATRTQFHNNCIPSNYLTPLTQELISFFPDPNDGPNTYEQVVPRNVIGDWGVGKGNWTITPHDSIDMHLLWQTEHFDTTGQNPAITATSLQANGINSGINYFRVISPSMVNVLRVAYTRYYYWQVAVNQTNFLSAVIPGWPNDGNSKGPPGISGNGISVSAPTFVSAFATPFRLKENNYQIQDMLTWQHGRHSFKFGAEYEQIRAWENRGRSGSGNLTFGGSNTTTSSGAATTNASSWADLLLNTASAVTANYVFVPNGIAARTHYIMPYVQDDWRATNTLTINVGLRYNIFIPYHFEHDLTANFDPTTGTVLIPDTSNYAVTDYGFTNGLPAHWAYVPRDEVYPHIYWKAFDPRIGFADQIHRRVVWRGGFGLYHTPLMGNTPMNGTTSGNDVSPSITTGAPLCLDAPAGTPQASWCGQIGLNTNPTAGYQAELTAQGFVPVMNTALNLPTPYSTKYTMDVEYSLMQNAVVDVGYLGANTQHFAQVFDGNEANVVSTTESLASRQPYPYFGQSEQFTYAQTDHTNYNGGFVSVQFRTWHGLEFKSSYTYSKTMGLGTGNDEVLVSPYYVNYDYGPLDYDIRHRWVTTFIYRMPKLSSPKLMGAIIGQWDLSGVINLQSGMPFTVTDSGGTAINIGDPGGSGQRPYMLHNPNLPKNKRTTHQWFDPTAFAHTVWCTGAPVNADILTATGFAANAPGNPCGATAVAAPPAPLLYTHVVSSTADTMPVPWGNEGKNILRGPGEVVFTTAIQRRFHLKKGYITLRLEEYNLFNHPNYSNPGGLNLNTLSDFGEITSSRTYPRQLHGALRFDF